MHTHTHTYNHATIQLPSKQAMKPSKKTNKQTNVCSHRKANHTHKQLDQTDPNHLTETANCINKNDPGRSRTSMICALAEVAKKTTPRPLGNWILMIQCPKRQKKLASWPVTNLLLSNSYHCFYLFASCVRSSCDLVLAIVICCLRFFLIARLLGCQFVALLVCKFLGLLAGLLAGWPLCFFICPCAAS